MKDVFAYIKHTTREYLLRCSYIEIYNETIVDLLAPPSSQPVQIQGSGQNVWLSPLREEVVTNFSSVKKVLERGDANRRTASTDWNERSSRSHSVFRIVIESRERGSGGLTKRDDDGNTSGRMTPTGRMTPGYRPQTPGGTKLQSRDGRSVQTSTLVRTLCLVCVPSNASTEFDRSRWFGEGNLGQRADEGREIHQYQVSASSRHLHRMR